MKKIFKIILFFFLIHHPFLNAETKIAFVDVDAIIYGSDIGKTMNKNFDQEFKKEESKLSETELNENITKLKEEISNFQKQRREANDKFRKTRLEQTNKLLQNLNKILADYAEKNSISIVIQKKNIVMGKTEFDITPDIFKIFNKEVRSLN